MLPVYLGISVQEEPSSIFSEGFFKAIVFLNISNTILHYILYYYTSEQAIAFFRFMRKEIPGDF